MAIGPATLLLAILTAGFAAAVTGAAHAASGANENGTEPPAGRPPDPGDFRSQSLLRLWTAEELAGQPGDERVRPQTPPRHGPPARTRTKTPLPSPVDPRFARSIRRVILPEGEKTVALSFDLCEQADEVTGYDRAIVNFLRERRIPATFYAGGKWMQSHPEKTLQLMADPLFEIGNHAWTHGNLHVLTGEKMREQIVWTQAEYQRIRDLLQERADAAGAGHLMAAIPERPASLRFPYGTCSQEALNEVNALGLIAVQWDVVGGDPDPKIPADRIVRHTLGSVRPGSIVVFHANGRGRNTAKALPQIVDALEKKGYAFKTVGALLQDGIPSSVPECYWLKPGDNAGIDAKFGEGVGKAH